MRTTPPEAVSRIYKNLLVQIFASLGYPVYENPATPGRFHLKHIPFSCVRKAILRYRNEEKEISKTFVKTYLNHLRNQRLTPGESCEAVEPDNHLCQQCRPKCHKYRLAS